MQSKAVGKHKTPNKFFFLLLKHFDENTKWSSREKLMTSSSTLMRQALTNYQKFLPWEQVFASSASLSNSGI